MDDIRLKRCTTCKKEYPATSEYFSTHKLTNDGLETRCRSCQRERNLAYRQKNHEREIQRKRLYRAENPDKVREYNQRYRSEHPEKIQELLKRYQSENREQILAKQRQYRQDNRERERARQKRYRTEHRNEQLLKNRLWRQAHPERMRELDRKWKAENPEKTQVIKQRRAARKRGLQDNFTIDDYQRMLVYWDNRCAVCGREAVDGVIIVPDHWIPLSDPRPENPGTVPENILPLCHSTRRGMKGCNNRKWEIDPLEWLKEVYGEEEAQVIQARIEVYFASLKIKGKN